MSKKKITQAELKESLNYDPETGIFTWRIDNVNTVSIGDVAGSKSHGYVSINVNCERYQAHRLAWLYTYGYFPENDIDHINRIRDDNRINNLREVSRQCNIRNSNTRTDNTSGIVGVCWHKIFKKFIAQIVVNKKNIHLGYFVSKMDAAKARWKAEVKYGFPNCNTTSSAYLYLKEFKGA